MEGEVERRLKSLDLKGANGSMSNPLIITVDTEVQRGKSSFQIDRAGLLTLLLWSPRASQLPQGWKLYARAPRDAGWRTKACFLLLLLWLLPYQRETKL